MSQTELFKLPKPKKKKVVVITVGTISDLYTFSNLIESDKELDKTFRTFRGLLKAKGYNLSIKNKGNEE